MPITLEQLVPSIQPERTTLILGAGAAVSSGAPTGADLARMLSRDLTDVDASDDLSEIASIYENRHGRKQLADRVRARLEHLEPSGGMKALALYDWASIYTTNFDQLLEKAFSAAGRDLVLVRSNYDFGRVDPQSHSTKFYKMHGCVTEDIAYGNRSGMLLTLRDYDSYEQYREAIFAALKFDMLTKDVLVLGHSLRDPHIKALADEVARLHHQQTTNGRLIVLSYSEDDDRALLLEQRGMQVAYGTLDGFGEQLTSGGLIPPAVTDPIGATDAHLPPRVVATTIDVASAVHHEPNAHRMYHGAAGSYADVRSNLTISRAIEPRVRDALRADGKVAVILTGAAGVGKTTLARRVLLSSADAFDHAWEHLNDFTLSVDGWAAVETTLREEGRTGVLFVDDCAKFLSPLSRLVEHLDAQERPALRLILTVHSSQWDIRSKSAVFFSKGSRFRLSKLDAADLEALLGLVDTQPAIKALVEPAFAILSRDQQLKQLRERCSSEMFVCLKNIFATERLDDILLREYVDLVPEAQEIYRHVAVLQAMGGRVHRQLIVRLLNVEGGRLSSLLGFLDDVVIENDIRPTDGLFGWSTRHLVIAEVIATYKFFDERDLVSLMNRIIDGLNPSLDLEVETARAICFSDYGIGRLVSPQAQLDLLQRIIAVIPGERVPRRRAIRKLLDLGRLEEADSAIRKMTAEIGRDSVCDRYRSRLALSRAESTPGVMEEDRKAMMSEAERIARRCVRDSPNDKKAYAVLANVAAAWVRRWQETTLALDVIDTMRRAESWVLDPELSQKRRGLEQLVSDYSRGASMDELEADFDLDEDDEP